MATWYFPYQFCSVLTEITINQYNKMSKFSLCLFDI